MCVQLNKDYPVAKTPETPAPSAYERLGLRIQAIINAPAAQRAKTALIFRLADEPMELWEQLLDEIDENDNVTLAHRDDGGVHVFWTVPKED